MASLYLPGVEADPKPGAYRTLIEAACARGGEYSKIWDLFAFQHDITIHLGRFTQGVLRTPASIDPGLRELIAAYTSHLNRCGFCTNPFAGGVARTGFSAHDPRNGMPFTWNPVRNPRGKGVLAMTSTATGFYFGSDTNNIHGMVRQKLAFMPLAGGVTQAPENPYTLPGNFYTVGQIGSPDALLRRSFDGSTFGAATSLSTGWNNVHGAFALNGRLYTGQSNGTLTPFVLGEGTHLLRRDGPPFRVVRGVGSPLEINTTEEGRTR